MIDAWPKQVCSWCHRSPRRRLSIVNRLSRRLLKAFLIWHEEEFEKTHDLRLLIERCGSHDPAFLDHQDTVEPLTAYAIRFRYPGPEDPSTDEVSAALDVVEQVWDFVLPRLPDDARP